MYPGTGTAWNIWWAVYFWRLERAGRSGSGSSHTFLFLTPALFTFPLQTGCLSFNLLKQSSSYSCLVCQGGLKPSCGFRHLSSTSGWIKHDINEFWMKASQRGPVWLISSYIIDHRIPLRSGTRRSSKMQISGKLSNASLTEHIINKSASTGHAEIHMINAAKIVTLD